MRTREDLTILLGPPNAGKLGRVFRWWELHRERRPFLVVPTHPDAVIHSHELVRRTGGLVGARPVGTFSELVREAGGEEPALLSEAERNLMVRRLLAILEPGSLSRIARYPGTVPAVARLLEDMGESGHSAERRLDALAAWELQGEPIGTASDLRALLREYEREKEKAQRWDRSDWTRSVAENVGDWTRPVACYGFTTFTPVQRMLLLSLSNRAPVLLAFSHEDGRRAHRYLNAEVGWWRAKASEVLEVSRQPRAYSSPQVEHIERTFMSGRYEAETELREGGRTLRTGVHFLQAAGRRNEVELVAERIRDLLAEGVPATEMAVLVRKMDPWWRHVRRVFPAFDIPCWVDAEPTLAETGMGSALLGLLRGAWLGHTDALEGFFRTRYSPAREGTHLAEELNLPSSDLEAIIDAVLRCADRLVWTAASRRTGSGREVEEDLIALRAVRDGAEGLRTSLRQGWLETNDTSFGGREIKEVLIRTLAEMRVGLSVSQGGGVLVSTVGRARARRFQIVFVLGLVEGEFPQSEGTSGLLTSTERISANRAGGIPLFPPDIVGEEEALFAHALSRAWQALYLSTRVMGDEGEQVFPSPFWLEAHRGLGSPPMSGRRTFADETPRPEQAATFRQYLRGCALHGVTPSAAEDADRLEGAKAVGIHAGRLTSAGALLELGARDSFSAAELERYWVCPFAWFVHHVLRAGPRREQRYVLERGRLLHEALFRVYSRLRDEGVVVGSGGDLRAARSLADACMEELQGAEQGAGVEPIDRLLWAEIRAGVLAALDYDFSSGSALRPVALEEPLGNDEGVDIGGVRVRGRVDRVDAGPGGGPLFAVDYKSGKTLPSAQPEKHQALQLPLYLLALRSRRRDAEIAGGAYLAVGTLVSGRRGVRSVVREEEKDLLGDWSAGRSTKDDSAFEKWLDGGRAAALSSAEGIREGRIPAESDGRICGTDCDLNVMCRR